MCSLVSPSSQGQIIHGNDFPALRVARMQQADSTSSYKRSYRAGERLRPRTRCNWPIPLPAFQASLGNVAQCQLLSQGYCKLEPDVDASRRQAPSGPRLHAINQPESLSRTSLHPLVFFLVPLTTMRFRSPTSLASLTYKSYHDKT